MLLNMIKKFPQSRLKERFFTIFQQKKKAGRFCRVLLFPLAAMLLAMSSIAEAENPVERKNFFHSSAPTQGGSIIMGTIGEPSNLIPYLSSDSASSQVTGLL
ncbi:MAG: hypothetical protein IJZ18_01255, partial [Mailhella sp.]|nr:hypothetical protein [Mailhella sp.]